MNREDFLQSVWSHYPLVTEVSGIDFFGRVLAIENDILRLKNQDGALEIACESVQSASDSQLGPSIPLDCLRRGDVVAWREKDSALFLLSPCLVASKKLFSQKPQEWSHFLDKVADFFKTQGFLHLPTPYLVPSPGVDHHIDFFSVQGVKSGQRYTLPTSPEIHLKKYLCQGYERIFEIKNCFRDDLPGPHHRQEFTMLEWYRAYTDLSKIQSDVIALIERLAGQTFKVESMTVSQCFAKYADFTLTAYTTKNEMRLHAEKLGISTHPTDDWNDIFFRIYMEKVEPQLGKNGLSFISQFPKQQASLAQLDNEGWAQRFEVYWQGVELANAYLEVNDPEENRECFEHEMDLRKRSDSVLPEWDEEFFRDMQSGMPPASGIALGLDRLFMLLQNKTSLQANHF